MQDGASTPATFRATEHSASSCWPAAAHAFDSPCEKRDNILKEQLHARTHHVSAAADGHNAACLLSQLLAAAHRILNRRAGIHTPCAPRAPRSSHDLRGIAPDDSRPHCYEVPDDLCEDAGLSPGIPSAEAVWAHAGVDTIRASGMHGMPDVSWPQVQSCQNQMSCNRLIRALTLLLYGVAPAAAGITDLVSG